MTNWEKYNSTNDRVMAFRRYCADIGCANCGIKPYAEAKHTTCVDRCILKWLALEAEEEQPIPCPFCGGESVAFSAMYGHIPDGARVRCTRCWAITPVYENKTEAIAAWNRRAK